MAGIKQIKIPLKAESITIEKILPFMATIMQTFVANATKVKHFRDVCENIHEIRTKERKYGDDSDINNKVEVPHLFSLVSFKSGYVLGNPKEYSQSQSIQTDDITYLNKYAKDSKMRVVDKDVITEVYTCGNCYYFVEPKLSLATLDLEYESPFNTYCKTSDICAKIYSSYNGEEELFDILVTKLDDKTTVISVYLPDFYYEIETNNLSDFSINESETMSRPIYKCLPLSEKFANKSRLGIVEIGESLQNAIDRVYSNQLDNIEDLVNELLIFKNCVLGNTPEEKADKLREAKKGGALEVFDPNPDVNADVKTLGTKLDHSDVFVLVESLKNELYSCCGGVIAISDTSNGGNKAGALQLGNGWENAYNRLLDEINSFISADYDVLKKQLFICKRVVNSKINELNASEIDIKYSPNMTDNMLSKSQSYKYFIECGVPPEIAIAWCRLSNDPITQGKMIQAYMDSKKDIDSGNAVDINNSEVVKTQKNISE